MSSFFSYFKIFLLCMLLSACASNSDFHPHLENSQNAYVYLNHSTANLAILTQTKQQQIYQKFLAHYYSPWTNKFIFTNLQIIKTDSENDIKQFENNPGWNANNHLHSKQWIATVIDNMQMSHFPNHLQPAITVQNTNERVFPTDTPSFTSLDAPGLAYPFDNFQGSYLPANLPIKILQQSKDHAWYLVLTSSSVGWVNASDIATVDKRFIYAWQHNQGYIAFKNDHFSIIDNLDVYRFSSRMGAIYPIRLTHLNYYIVNLAIKNINGKAVLISTKINKNSVYKIPLFITPHNIATIANQFINIPYGWGGLYGYRDCSATMKDIFTYFGIWLPENSTQQAKLGGKQINLEKLPNQKKQEIILQQGVPFFTLVHLNGHIMLYLGEKNNQLYVLHNMWGLKTFRLFNSDGRAVVGKTVITSIDFGEGYINVKNSLLDKVVGITLLEENKEPH